MANALQRQHSEVPAQIRINLLIDTGADTTTLDEMHMRSLGIPARGAAKVRGITRDAHPTECNAYDISMELMNFAGDPPFIIPAVEVLALPFHNDGIDGVIGRDFLANMVFLLEGPHRQFTLNY